MTPIETIYLKWLEILFQNNALQKAAVSKQICYVFFL